MTTAHCHPLDAPKSKERSLLAETIVDLLRQRADSARRFTFLDALGNPTTQTYADVVKMAAHYARVLHRKGVKPADRVVVMLPTCPEYLYTFFGIILAGAIPVPVYPPFNPKQLVAFLGTLTGVFRSSAATAIVYWKDVKPLIGDALARAPEVRFALDLAELARPDLHGPLEYNPPPLVCNPHDTAMLQYTSGSTDQPKGVELSHLNLLYNMEAVRCQLRLVPGQDVVVSWLPLYHDMGLIGIMIGAIYSHIDMVLMGPQSFLMRPKLWLKAISDYRATITAAPNFAFNLCVSRLSSGATSGLDLSCLRVAICGAEPIRFETVEAFVQRFEAIGFRRNMFVPVYGLAESTLAVTFPEIECDATVLWLDREALETGREAKCVLPGADRGLAAFGCGRPFEDSAIRILDPDTQVVLPEGRVGEIQLLGPSIMKGYFRNPNDTRDVKVDGGWLRTGDLGFVQDDNLFITGRLKDLIIRNGRNYYPQDLEFVIEQLEGVRKGCVVAFGHLDGERGTEEIVVLVETRLRSPICQEELRSHIREALASQLSLVPDTIELLPPHTLLKTSSGKLRRRPSKDLYLEGRLSPRRDSLIQQFRVIARSQLYWGTRRIASLWLSRTPRALRS